MKPPEEIIVGTVDMLCKLVACLSDEEVATLYGKIDNRAIKMPSDPHPALLSVLSQTMQLVTHRDDSE